MLFFRPCRYNTRSEPGKDAFCDYGITVVLFGECNSGGQGSSIDILPNTLRISFAFPMIIPKRLYVAHVSVHYMVYFDVALSRLLGSRCKLSRWEPSRILSADPSVVCIQYRCVDYSKGRLIALVEQRIIRQTLGSYEPNNMVSPPRRDNMR